MSGGVSRLRVALQGSRSLAARSGATHTPSLESGLRHDAGGAEAGFELEYAAPAQSLTLEGRMRGP